MTRFKELRRIEAALENGDARELRWAQDYCRMRLKLATTKHAMQHWSRVEARVSTALLELETRSE